MFGTSLIFGYSCTHLILITSTVLHGSYFLVCAVVDVSERHESDWVEIMWACVESYVFWYLLAQTKVYQWKCSGLIQIKTEFKWGPIHIACSELWSSASPFSQLLPNLGLFTFQLPFFTWLLWTKFSRKFQVQPQPKILLSWLIQTAQRIFCHSSTMSK